MTVGAEKLLQHSGNNTGSAAVRPYLTRRCSRRITLAFLPFAFRVQCEGNYDNTGRQARPRLNATLDSGSQFLENEK